MARRSARALCGLVAVAAAAVVLIPDLLGLDGWLPFAEFVAVRPTATVALGAVALLALVRAVLPRRRAAALSTGTDRRWPVPVVLLAVVGLAAAGLLPRLVADEAAPAGGPALSLLSANVFEGRADPVALAATLRERHPDVVVLPESAERFRARLLGVAGDLGYRSWVAAPPGAPDVEGVTVLAGPRLGDVRERVVLGGEDPWIELTGGLLGATRLVGVHTAAPVPTKIGGWRRDLAALGGWCGHGSVVVAGDLNATADHRLFRAGTRGCRDAGERAGRGLVPTWHAAWPRWFGAQIDHVLAGADASGRGPTTRGLAVLPVAGSDHRAVTTEVTLPSGP